MIDGDHELQGMVRHARAMAHRYTPVAKALQLQPIAATDGTASEGGWADAFVGSWAFIAPPAKPTVDSKGNVSGACELLVTTLGDQLCAIGQRDVRWAKYTQDAKDGESVQINAFGDRLLLAEKLGVLSIGGGSIVFDKTKKMVAITGIPSSPGGPAPYFVMDATTIGMVSATGAASVAIKANKVTMSGGAASLDVGSVNLGVGAVDGVVLNSLLTANLVVLMAWANTHTHLFPATGGAPTSPPTAPLVLSSFNGSLRVKAA